MAAPSNVNVSYLVLTLFLLVLSQISENKAEVDDPPRIAVVGAGIGGTTCIYYLKELFGKDVSIDVFEKKVVGGRLKTVNIDKHYYEAGGSILHPRNKYMVNFTKILGLRQRDSAPEERMGIWNGTDILFEGSRLPYWTVVKLAWRYGLDIVKINTWIDDLLKDFDRIYEHQQQGYAYSTVEELIHSMSTRLLNMSKIPIAKVFENAGFSDLFVKELVLAAMRMNYGQSTDIHGFVGAISMAGVQSGLWSVHGGNKLIPEKILERTNITIINAEVTKISLDKETQHIKYYLEYTLKDENNNIVTDEREYDVVILAAPLVEGESSIELENIPRSLDDIKQQYHRTVALFAQGLPNMKHFGYANLYEHTENMMTNNAELYFNCLGKQDPVFYTTRQENWYSANDADKSVWKVFSQRPLTAPQLNTLFQTKENLKEFDWVSAYPEYSSTARLSLPFVLNDQFYYINAIEQAASAMEMSIIGARNVALLAYNQWRGLYDNINPSIDAENDTDEIKSEL